MKDKLISSQQVNPLRLTPSKTVQQNTRWLKLRLMNSQMSSLHMMEKKSPRPVGLTDLQSNLQVRYTVHLKARRRGQKQTASNYFLLPIELVQTSSSFGQKIYALHTRVGLYIFYHTYIIKYSINQEALSIQRSRSNLSNQRVHDSTYQ